MLRFGLFGFPVRVQWTFWLTALLLSGGLTRTDRDAPIWMLAWTLAVFISVLWHELGHAFAFRRFRGYPEIVLYHFGGYAQSSGSLSRRESMIVSAAGPLFQLALWAAMLGGLLFFFFSNGGSVEVSNPLHVLTRPGLFLPFASTDSGKLFVNSFLVSMLYVNFYWPLLNMIPVLPLDGGQFTEALTGNRRKTLQISTWCGFGVAVLALLSDRPFLAVMFGLLGYQSLMMSRGMSAQFPWRR